MTACLPFAIDQTYPANFPKDLPLDEDDPLSYQTPRETCLAAQSAGIPYYVVAVVLSTSKDATQYFHSYDASCLADHLKKNGGTDPVSANRSLKSIILRCLALNQRRKQLFSAN